MGKITLKSKVANFLATYRIKKKVAKGVKLQPEEEMFLLELPNAKELLKEYIKSNYLCYDVQIKIFELENAEELLGIYLRTYYLM